MTATPEPLPEPSPDLFLDGRVRARQLERGYRAGLDAILLAAAVTEGETLIEAGCGAGVALLAVASRFPDAVLFGIEREPDAAALAEGNVVLNGVSNQVRIVRGDALDPDLPVPPADGVFFNPPYGDARLGAAPAPARRPAFIADRPIADWIGRLANRLRGGGAMTLIHRADHAPDILAGLSGRLGGVSLLPVHPKPAGPASRVLVRAVKGSRAPFRLLAPLLLHCSDGAFTPETEDILRGRATIAWG